MSKDKKIWRPARKGEQVDEHHGQGGTYVVDDEGKRQLVKGSRTEFPAQGGGAKHANGQPADQPYDENWKPPVEETEAASTHDQE